MHLISMGCWFWWLIWSNCIITCCYVTNKMHAMHPTYYPSPSPTNTAPNPLPLPLPHQHSTQPTTPPPPPPTQHPTHYPSPQHSTQPTTPPPPTQHPPHYPSPTNTTPTPLPSHTNTAPTPLPSHTNTAPTPPPLPPTQHPPHYPSPTNTALLTHTQRDYSDSCTTHTPGMTCPAPSTTGKALRPSCLEVSNTIPFSREPYTKEHNKNT